MAPLILSLLLLINPNLLDKKFTDARIWAIVHKRMPLWARKFSTIWDKLTKEQAEAFKLEWFYMTDEKLTQSKNATLLGISIDSYQERLEWAVKKIIKLYPKFTPQKRRSKAKKEKVIQSSPLYKILPSGEKIEMELTLIRRSLIAFSFVSFGLPSFCDELFAASVRS